MGAGHQIIKECLPQRKVLREQTRRQHAATAACLRVLELLFFIFQTVRIFHCLNIPQNLPDLEYKLHLAKNCIIYCRPKFPPLDGAIIKESAFWLIIPIYCVAHLKTLEPRIK